jgi:hypothetical protein
MRGFFGYSGGLLIQKGGIFCGCPGATGKKFDSLLGIQ